MKSITNLIKIMFAVFILLQILSFSHLYGNPDYRYGHVDSYLTGIEQSNRSMLTVHMMGGDLKPYHRSIGYQNLHLNHPADANSAYRIGGLSKLFTSIIIMQMIDEKMIQLGTPLSRFFPELPYAKNISIEDLLAENIIVADYLPGGKFYSHFLNGRNFRSTLNDDLKPLVYSAAISQVSSNYLLLGLIIEKITNTSYHQVVSERVIEKAGLFHTFDGSTNKLSENSAVAYSIGVTGIESQGSWDLTSVKGAASIYSTPSDLVHLITQLFNGEMVSDKSLNNMKQSRNFSGLGMEVMNVQGKTAYGYKGELNGYISEWIYIPQDSLTIAYSMNLDDGKSESIMNELVSAYYMSIGS